jgi:Tol biopolymer transport system component
LLQTFHNPSSGGIGEFVAALGDTVLVGSPGADTAAEGGGVVYAFDSVTGKLLRTYVSPNPTPGEHFGSCIVPVGNSILIGAKGSEYQSDPGKGAVYLIDGASAAPIRTYLNPYPEIEAFGRCIAKMGDKLLIGAPMGKRGGTVYVFEGIPEPTTVRTDANGGYTFTEQPPGNYLVRVVAPEGYAPTNGDTGTAQTVVIDKDAPVSQIDFALKTVADVASELPSRIDETQTQPPVPTEPPAPTEPYRLPNGWVIHPPENLGPTVNTRSTEGAPALSTDALTLLFTSNRPGGQGGSDIWMSSRASLAEPFGEPVNLGPIVNTSFNEGSPALSADGLTLLFDSDRPGGHGDYDLWMCTRPSASEPFGEPVTPGPRVNSSGQETRPALSADGLTLLFCSHRRPGGLGWGDLWMCKRTSSNEPFGAPVTLGPTVNSIAHDAGPVLSADGLTLLFYANRGRGQDGFDLWMCQRASADDTFGKPFNLGPTVNSRANERHPALSADGLTLLFCSDRPGGQGGADLWMARIEQGEIPTEKESGTSHDVLIPPATPDTDVSEPQE